MKQQSKYLLFSIGVVMLSVANADSPMEQPYEHLICSNSKHYCAYLNPLTNVKVFNVKENDVPARVIWTVPGWHRYSYLSDDGKYFVSSYGSLLPRNNNQNINILRIWEKGTLIHEIKASELIDNKKLVETTSHYYWGNTIGFEMNNIFLISTVEDETLKINVETGRVVK